MSEESNRLAQTSGTTRDTDARRFEDAIATMDVAAQIIEMLRHTKFSPEGQEEEIEDDGPEPQSPTRVKVYNAGTSSWRKASFPVVAAVSQYQRKLMVARAKVGEVTWSLTASSVLADLDRAKTKVYETVQTFTELVLEPATEASTRSKKNYNNYMSEMMPQIYQALDDVQVHISSLEEEHAQFCYSNLEALSSSNNSRESTPEPTMSFN